MRAKSLEERTVEAPLLCDLNDELAARHLHRLCVGARRDVLLLSADEPLKVRAGKSKSVMRFRVHDWHAGELSEFDLPTQNRVFYFVQKMGANYLCVASRCAPEEKNAHLFADDGTSMGFWHFGDGIEDVQIAPNGNVWVSYFDEGVFGDTPLSQQGLVCFDPKMKQIFGFQNDVGSVPEFAEGMADCYALNVASNRDTWLCYYTGFPLVHLRDLAFKDAFLPPSEMIGSHAFAVCDWRRLFVGGYKFRNRLFWRDERNGRQIEIKAIDETGEPVTWNQVCGRGTDLFLIQDARVRMLSLDEIGF